MPLGCQRSEEPVVSYSVPKDEAIQIPVETPGGADDASQAAAPQPKTAARMLAALILDGDVSWSFKAMTAPETFPENAAEHFTQLIQSLKLDNPQKPSWDLGDRWQELPGSGMRTANLVLDGLEFSVIKLPAQSILENVNRWRGQLNLPPLGETDLASNVRTVQTQDGHDATLLDLSGTQSSGGPMGPMMQQGSTPRPQTSSPPPSQPKQSPPQSQTKPFTDTPPANWQAVQAGMMQLATYQLQSDGKAAKVSVSRAGGDVLANINRWRGQVSLAPLSDLSDAKVQMIQVSDQPALLAEIHGTGGQSIVVAMSPADRPTWFFKLQGDTSLVQENTASFQEYLSTVKLE